MDSAGHFAATEYTHGYYREISPPLLRFACLSAGIEPPTISRYLELGCGHGVSLAIHAAANEGEFWGNDFHPAHVAYARAMPSPATVLPDSFEQLANVSLPDFDAIVLHGILSWVSEENRAIIADLIHRRLRPGGLVYVSYNCIAGWAQNMPLRHLMNERGKLGGGVAAAVSFARRVKEAGVPLDLSRFDSDEPAYIAAEYLTEDWQAFGSAEVARWIGLPFICSANLADHVDGINLTADGAQLLAETPDPLKQTVRDMLLGQKFRKDIFVKEPRSSAGGALDAQRLVLSVDPEKMPLAVATPLGTLGLREDIYRPLLRCFPCTFGEIDLPLHIKLEAVRILVGAAVLHPAQDPSEEIRARCETLNRYLDTRPEIEFRASPITGAGLFKGS